MFRQYISNPLIQYAGVMLAVALSIFLIYQKGRVDERAHQANAAAKAQASAARVAAKQDAKAADLSAEVRQATVEKQIEYRTITKTLIKEVPKYVTAEADAACVIPVGFVRLHDVAAGSGQALFPPAAGGPVDAPSGLDLSAVSSTVVANYGTAHLWRAEAEGWRAWYLAQREAWDNPPH